MKKLKLKHLNQWGSFTIEASIFFSVIVLIVLLFFHQYIYHFCFYSYRNLLFFSKEGLEVKKQGLYERVFVKEGTLTYLDKEKNIEVYHKTYDYLKCTHHYMMTEELGDKISEVIETY